MIYNVMTCGVGGQGLMLVSNIIGLACARFGYGIRTAETHGLAQRSGSIYTHIRISDGEEIFSPLIPPGEADVLLSMEAMEALRNIEFLKRGGTIILNEYVWQPVQSTFERVKEPEKPYLSIEEILGQLSKVSEKILVIDALKLANIAGNPLTSNVVLLGLLARQEGFNITLDQLREVLPEVVPEKALEANREALSLGFKHQGNTK